MKTNKPNFCNQLNRREFLKDIGGGFAALGLTGMLAQDGFFASKAMASVPEFVNPLAPKPAPLPAKAKSVIFLFMYGGPATWIPLIINPNCIRSMAKPFR